MSTRLLRMAVGAAVLTTSALWLAGSAFGVTVTSFTPVGGVTADDFPNCSASIVQVSGSGFVNDGPSSSVKASIGGTQASFIQITADNAMNVAVPKGATSGAITVTTAAGTATSSTSLTVVPCPTAPNTVAAGATTSGQTSVVAKPVPAIASFSPAKGKAGAKITIVGSNFTGATSVKIGGVSARFKVVSATKLTATVPSTAKSGKITVTTGGGRTISARSFSKL